jgi:hypothetical protein
MTDVNRLLARVVDDAPPATITPASAIAAGRRARRRRRGMAGAGVGAIAMAVASVIALAVPPGAPTPTIVAEEPGSLAAVPVLRPADDVPSASARPDLVGADARAVRFSLDFTIGPIGQTGYSSGNGSETLVSGAVTIRLSQDNALALVVATATDIFPGTLGVPQTLPADRRTTRTDVRVNGRRGSLYTVAAPGMEPLFTGLMWSPVEGVWVAMATFVGTGANLIWLAENALALDRAQRCVVPFSLPTVPANLRLSWCHATIPADSATIGRSTVEFTGGDKPQIWVSAGKDPDDTDPPAAPNRTVAGQAAHWSGTDTGQLRSDNFHGLPITVGVVGRDDGEAVAQGVLAGAQIAADPHTPTSWPLDPAPGLAST